MKRLLFRGIALSFIFALGLAAGQQQLKPQPKSAVKNTNTQTGTTSEGEKRFRINCGRCHNPPEDISPREARAVIRQMRVRAMLSAEDEKFILEYLAP
jgi:cytochrome c5